jgi:hypothetical protein
MKKTILIAGLGITVLAGWIAIGPWGCEWTPERDNPLDPGSDLFNPILTGEVRNLANTPVSQAIVTLYPEGNAVVTSDDGVYRFEGVDLGEYTLTVQKTDHVDDTVDVDITFGGTTTQELYINALPVFDSVSVTSHNIEQEFTNDVYVTVEAWIYNGDGDPSMDSVLVVFEDDTLGYLNNTQTIDHHGIFHCDFGIDTAFTNIDPFSLELILGRAFLLTVFDFQGGLNNSDPSCLIRFLEPPFTNNPSGPGPYPQAPTFDWDLYDVEFEFLQNLHVFDNIGDLVWDSLSIAPDVIQVTATSSLPPTQPTGPLFYYWTLEIVDIFGNTTRSQELIFEVE